MNEPKISFSIINFRAVENAHIALDGISVLAGENGCGKSSISKLLYHTIDSMINYGEVTEHYFENDYYKIHTTIEKLYTEFPEIFKSKKHHQLDNSNQKFHVLFNNLFSQLPDKFEFQNNIRLNTILLESLLPALQVYEKGLSKFLGAPPSLTQKKTSQKTPCISYKKLTKP